MDAKIRVIARFQCTATYSHFLTPHHKLYEYDPPTSKFYCNRIQMYLMCYLSIVSSELVHICSAVATCVDYHRKWTWGSLFLRHCHKFSCWCRLFQMLLSKTANTDLYQIYFL